MATDSDRIDQLTRQVNSLAERMTEAEQVWLAVSNRQASVDGLATATDRLATSASSVETALKRVDEAMTAATDAKTTAENVQRGQVSREDIESGHNRVARRAALLALGSLLIALAAVGTTVWRNHVDTYNQNAARYAACLTRNTQATEQATQTREGAQYAARVFAAITAEDPELGRALAKIPAPQPAPFTPPVVCPRP